MPHIRSAPCLLPVADEDDASFFPLLSNAWEVYGHVYGIAVMEIYILVVCYVLSWLIRGHKQASV